MSPTLFACPICGSTVGGIENPTTNEATLWLSEFRGLYRGPDELVLTGVGIYDDSRLGIYSAPRDTAARWDDEGYESGNEDDAFGVMRQPAINGRSGFALHNACWLLLNASCQPQPCPLERLYDICFSIPISQTILNWGHDYGGLVRIGREAHYPWEEPDVEDDLGIDVALHNPYNITEIQEILRRQPEHPPYSQWPAAQLSPAQPDQLRKLPEELLVAIAQRLPTPDFLNARLATRAFWSVFHTQSFWASRFSGSGERSWLLATVNHAPTLDWRSIYYQTTASRLTPTLQNRRRIWYLIDMLVPLLNLHVITPNHPTVRTRLGASGYQWKDASADFQPTINTAAAENSVPIAVGFPEGCRELNKASVVMVENPSKFTFYFVDIGNTRFLSGIKVTTNTGSQSSLGYESATAQYHHASVMSMLKGFTVAIGSRGVQAIRIHYGADYVSNWYGDTSQCPQTLRSLASSPVSAIRASFDGCKIVSISVAEKPPSTEIKTPPHQSSLHKSGIWFPTIPSVKVSLNEGSFPQLQLHSASYRPLFWISYRSAGGMLRHLSKLSVTIYNYIYGIQFAYSDSAQVDELGRHAYHSSEYKSYAETREFYIDGANGELIDSIAVFLKYAKNPNAMPSYVHGAMIGFEVFTNHGRSKLFMDDHTDASRLVKKELTCEPGTIITGFYASQDNNSGLKALGLISEALGSSS